MKVDIEVPDLPESVQDATVAAWRRKPGEAVAEGEPLLDLETDKVTLEVPAPVSGTLAVIRQAEGATVSAGDVLGQIETAAAKTVPEPAPEPDAKPAAIAAPSPAVSAAQPAESDNTLPKLGPAARRLIEEHGLDPAVIPRRREDRLTRADVEAYLAAQGVEPSPRPERRVPMSRLRRRIAERLLAAQREHAILTTFNEADMQAVTELRRRYRDHFEARHGVRLGFMSFFVAACVAALRRFPQVNASIDGGDIVYHGYYDIGIAVGTDRGLVVPVLRDADRMPLHEIERRIADFARRARENRLELEELQGGTFTITNGGVFGSLLSTPILNPPQSAILGMHRIQSRPVAVDGEVVIRPMMYLALSYDHRLIDGREAVQFLVAVKEAVEDPQRLLLDL